MESYERLKRDISNSKGEPLMVYIDSQGGSVQAGIRMYDLLRTAKNQVTTIAKKAQSIASIVYLGADERLVMDELAEPLLLHLPRLPKSLVEGTADNLRITASVIQSKEDRMIEIYSRHLNLTKKEVKVLLNKDVGMTSKEAVEIGMATAIQQPLEAEAFYDHPKTKNKNKMKELIKALTDFVSQSAVAEYKALTSEGVELIFPDVEAREPKEGDKVTNSEGEYLMPNGDTWIVADGVLSEVIKKVEEVENEIEAEEENDKEETEVKEEEKLSELIENFTAIFEKQIKDLSDRIDELEETKGASEKEIEEIKLKFEEEIVALKGSIDGEEADRDIKAPKSWINTKPNKL